LIIGRQKRSVGDLAVLGGERLFETIISTSNLVRPDIERFLDYSRRYHSAGHYTNNGPMARLLEDRLAAFHQARRCISFANGFWALALTIRALATPGKREIVMPSLTYRRLADIAAWAGLTPRFCEVDPYSLAADATTIAACVNRDTALILAVHPIVNCCDAEGIVALGRDLGVPVVFDSVESAYETVGGRKVGSFGAAECFSLHASKLINGFEGGYVTTHDEDLARRLALMRGFGFAALDEVVELGLNAKLNEAHACMALACLDDLEAQVVRNRARYQRYRSALAAVAGLRLLEFDEAEKTSYKTIVVELTADWPLGREKTLEILHAEGALARPYYHPPLHQKTMSYPHVEADLPLTDQLADAYLLLPCGHFVTDAHIDSVCGLLGFLSQNAEVIGGRRRQ
jgi:dTDP-4-amino-4,6-dideoxygalactose transaminase